MAPTRKLKGAQARLFGEICEHYIDAANMECNDKPERVILFSKLSPHQRMHLVREIMVGVLCEDEPLPPNTIQHNATFRAMIETLFVELEVELDTQYGSFGGPNIGEDLWVDDDEDDNRRVPLTKEEIEENMYQWKLIDYRADRNFNKMNRKKHEDKNGKNGKNDGNGTAFHVKEEKKNVDIDSLMERCNDVMKELYERGPKTAEEREKINRRAEKMTCEEESTFRWRLLCDAAFQEDFSFPFPLSMIDFDWRCTTLQAWYDGINLLFDTRLMDYKNATERALIFCEFDAKMYADPQQLPRIRTVENHVKILRSVYESKWERKHTGYDERCIFALTSNEKYYGKGHGGWVEGFIEECDMKGIDFYNKGNDTKKNHYQKRLDIFRNTIDDYTGGMELPFVKYSEIENIHPKDWKGDEYYHGFSGVTCFRCYQTENLKSCTRCNVAVYCSKECQARDWPNHKKQCERLAKERKDKKKIAEMAKSK